MGFNEIRGSKFTVFAESARNSPKTEMHIDNIAYRFCIDNLTMMHFQYALLGFWALRKDKF